MAKSEKTGKKGVAADFRKRLKTAGKAWGAAKVRASEKQIVEFEDGKYLARLVNAEVGESNNGRLQAVFTWKFEDGDYEGKEKRDYQGMETEQNLEFLARLLARFGYDLPEDLSDVVDIFEDMKKEKPLAKIRLRSKGDFQNVYVDKVLSATEEEEGEAEESEETEETEDADTEETEEEETEEEEPAPKKGKKNAAPAAEEEEEEEEEEEAEEEDEEDEGEAEDDAVELTVGMTVEAETTKGKQTGEVIEILEAEGKARIRTAAGKVFRIDLDKIEVPDEVPEEPAPKKKAKK